MIRDSIEQGIKLKRLRRGLELIQIQKRNKTKFGKSQGKEGSREKL